MIMINQSTDDANFSWIKRFQYIGRVASQVHNSAGIKQIILRLVADVNLSQEHKSEHLTTSNLNVIQYSCETSIDAKTLLNSRSKLQNRTLISCHPVAHSMYQDSHLRSWAFETSIHEYCNTHCQLPVTIRYSILLEIQPLLEGQHEHWLHSAMDLDDIRNEKLAFIQNRTINSKQYRQQEAVQPVTPLLKPVPD